jgi:diaminopimelate epimerase
MDIYNSDGSRAPMCGNGIRCFAHYCVSEGLVARDADTFDVATLAGMMRVRVFDEGEDGFSAEIAMGKPDFSARAAGIDEDGEYLRRTLNVCGRDIVLSGLFMGTYHAVVWTDENDIGAEGPLGLYRDAVLMRIGGVLSEYPAFTQRINVNFAHIVDRENVEMITWERGAGLTAACGTGACAVTALGILEDRLGCAVRVALPYGTLSIRRADDGTMFMRGPAVRVFTGEEAL